MDAPVQVIYRNTRQMRLVSAGPVREALAYLSRCEDFGPGSLERETALGPVGLNDGTALTAGEEVHFLPELGVIRKMTEHEWLSTPLLPLNFKGRHKPTSHQAVVYPKKVVVWRGAVRAVREFARGADKTVRLYEPYKSAYPFGVSSEAGVAGQLQGEVMHNLSLDLQNRGHLLEWVHQGSTKGKRKDSKRAALAQLGDFGGSQAKGGERMGHGTAGDATAWRGGVQGERRGSPAVSTEGGGSAAAGATGWGPGATGALGSDAAGRGQAPGVAGQQGVGHPGLASASASGGDPVCTRAGRLVTRPSYFVEQQVERASLADQARRRKEDFDLEELEERELEKRELEEREQPGKPLLTCAGLEVKFPGILPDMTRSHDDDCPLVDDYDAGVPEAVQTTSQGFGYACFRGYRHIAYSDWPFTYIARRQLADPMVLEVAGPFWHGDNSPTIVAALAFLQREAAAQTDLPLEMADSGYGEPPRSVAYALEESPVISSEVEIEKETEDEGGAATTETSEEDEGEYTDEEIDAEEEDLSDGAGAGAALSGGSLAPHEEEAGGAAEMGARGAADTEADEAYAEDVPDGPCSRLPDPKRRRSDDGDDPPRPVMRRTTAKDFQRRVPGGGTAAEDGAGAAGTGAGPGAKDGGEEPAAPREAVGVAASVGPRDEGQIAGAETAWGTRSSTPGARSERAGFSDQGLDDQKFKLQRSWEPERAHQARPRGKLGKWARRDWLLNGYKVVLPPPRVRCQKALPMAALNRTGMYVGNGACGRVEVGCLGGVAVALKFTDVREGLHDVAPLCNEVLKYARLAELQGSVIPELVWSGWTGAGAVYAVATRLIEESTLGEAALTREERESCQRSAEDGLRRIHARGVVHNDLSTQNVLVVGRRRVVFLDFASSLHTNAAGERARDWQALRGLFAQWSG